MAELLTTATALLTPTPHGPRSADALDAVRLERDGAGRVVASTRHGDTAGVGDDIVTAAALALLGRAHTAWGGLRAAPLQSAVVRVRERRYPDGARWRSTTVIARLETVGGPVLVGTGHAGTGTGLPTTGVPQLPVGTLDDVPPPDWRSRPLLLAPPVAARIVTAAWSALTSTAGRSRVERLVGARVLPGLGLLDAADGHPPHRTDDAGHPAGDVVLVEAGVLRPQPRDHDTGLLAGRAVWDHDDGRCAPAPHASLTLTGPGAPFPGDALELLHCVEDLQRHHADGVLRLLCLARAADRPDRWSRLLLRGRPLALLQAVRGTTGAPERLHTDHTATTPGLLLPAAEELAEKGTGLLAHS